jgi:hypothetical protein
MPELKDDLLDAIEASDKARASKLFSERIGGGEDAQKIHDSLFQVVQHVLNPPFINPHLPKMYHICRELFPYLEKDQITDLVRLEVEEYTRRSKLRSIPKKVLSSPRFSDIESAIEDQDWEKTAYLFAALYNEDAREFARRLLLIGSGYLDDSLGHSVSCTAFILLEILEKVDQDPWPALATLADYFCKGRFSETPTLRSQASTVGAIGDNLLRAASGLGIVNLHHTITLYAIERTRQLLKPREYDHILTSWTEFMGDKEAEPFSPDDFRTENMHNYEEFYQIFRRLDVKPAVACLSTMFDTESSRRQLAHFLIKGVCDFYQGDYNPHYLTALGSVLWVIDRFWNQMPIALTALYQYIDFFFTNVKR